MKNCENEKKSESKSTDKINDKILLSNISENDEIQNDDNNKKYKNQEDKGKKYWENER